MGEPSGGTLWGNPQPEAGGAAAISTRSPFNRGNPYGGTLWGNPQPEAGGAAVSSTRSPFNLGNPYGGTLWGNPQPEAGGAAVISTRSPFNGGNPGGTRAKNPGLRANQHQEPIQWGNEPIWGNHSQKQGRPQQAAPEAHSIGGTQLGEPI